MTESAEVETDKLQDQIAEVHEELAHDRSPHWVRYVGLGAAIFAVVAAIAALRSGDLINEAMIEQIKASDTWTEYQAAREKEHTYTIALNDLFDRGSKNVARVREYRVEIAKETAKETPLAASARQLEEESAAEVVRHHAFEYAVALLQVGIALGAVAALARSMPAWYVSLAAGAVGIVFFLRGFAS
jgi:lysozyme family protein